MIGDEGKTLIIVYSKVIGLPIKCIKEIICKNKIAELFLQQEPALKTTSDLENLEILVRITLLRKLGDLSKLTQKDVEFIYKNYDINVPFILQNKDSKCKTLDIIKIFEKERKNGYGISKILEK